MMERRSCAAANPPSFHPPAQFAAACAARRGASAPASRIPPLQLRRCVARFAAARRRAARYVARYAAILRYAVSHITLDVLLLPSPRHGGAYSMQRGMAQVYNSAKQRGRFIDEC